MRRLLLIFLITTSVVLLLPRVADAQDQNRVTILYDAFGKPSSLQKDWGFAALARIIQCAVERRRTSVGEYRPTRQLSLQPVAVRADVEATKRLKPLM